MNEYIYTIKGNPTPLQRPRFSKGNTYDPQASEKEEHMWELKYQHLKHFKKAFTDPLSLEVFFYMSFPHSMSPKKRDELALTPHFKRPDIDNLLKWVLDVGNGVIWEDDALIHHVVTLKAYDHEARTEIRVHKTLPKGIDEEWDEEREESVKKLKETRE